jgi:two-component system response regulator HydG
MDMTERAKVLIVDDELIVRESLLGWLRKTGHQVAGAESGTRALGMMSEAPYDLVFLDMKMPDMSGIEVLKRIRADYPDTLVIMITAFGSVESAVEAMKLGANDYLSKPFEPELLAIQVDKLLQQRRLIEENAILREQMSGCVKFADLIGTSPCMQELFSLTERVAKVESPILIRGETGTGKELIARAIHSQGNQSKGPFIPINCGAFTETLLESELFGHEAGSFTGANRARKGRLEMADGGTLFLDEIGEVPPKMQVDLLRVLQEKRFQRVGGSKEVSVNFRLVSATHRDLAQEIARGTFRQDFYFRLNVIEIQVPPLRARRGDLPILTEHFLERFRNETNKSVTGIQKQALELLESYDWPGNVRELENALERAVVLARGSVLTRDDFGFLFRTQCLTAPHSLDDVEREHIEQTLKYCQWNISKSARVLGVNRTTLHNKIKKYDLRVDDAGADSAKPGLHP